MWRSNISVEGGVSEGGVADKRRSAFLNKHGEDVYRIVIVCWQT